MSFLPSQGVSPSSLFGVCGMKVLGLGSKFVWHLEDGSSEFTVEKIGKKDLTCRFTNGTIFYMTLEGFENGFESGSIVSV